MLSGVWLDAYLERYLRALESQFPKSIMGRLDGLTGSSYSSDDHIIRYLEFAAMANPLRYCTQRQAKAIVLYVSGRCYLPEYTKHSMTSIQTGGRTRQVTAHEAASILGISTRQYYNEINTARTCIARALEDFHSRNRASVWCKNSSASGYESPGCVSGSYSNG